MPSDAHVNSLAHTIQIAVAPVFLLSALGTILSVLAGRLGRIVDRTRVIDERLSTLKDGDQRARLEFECELLHKRRWLVNYAITFATVSALLICLLVAFAFVGFVLNVDFANLMAVLFVAAIASIIVGLILFLREVLHAVVNSHAHSVL